MVGYGWRYILLGGPLVFSRTLLSQLKSYLEGVIFPFTKSESGFKHRLAAVMWEAVQKLCKSLPVGGRGGGWEWASDLPD